MPDTVSKKAYQRYTLEFKDKVVGIVNLGKPVAEVSQELDVSTSMLYEWPQVVLFHSESYTLK